MNLKDLKASITELPTDELIALVKDIRQSRRTPKRIYAEPKATKPKQANSNVSLDALLKSVDPATLLAALQGVRKEK